MPRLTRKVDWALAVARLLLLIACLSVLYFAWLRLHYGYNPRDEALYVAQPLRFVLGDRPFRDEVNISQTAAPFLMPFVALFVKWKGSTDGIILFTRYLFFFSTLAVSLLSYFALRRKLGGVCAAAIALVVVTYLPYLNTPNLNYISQNSLFFLTGSLFWLINKKRRVWIDLVSGVFHAFAAISFPPAIAVAVFHLAAYWLADRKQGWRPVGIYCLGWAAGALPLLLYFDWTAVGVVAEYARKQGYGSGSLASLQTLLTPVHLIKAILRPLVFAIAALSPLFLRRYPRVWLAVLLGVPLFFVLLDRESKQFYLRILPFAPMFAVAVWTNQHARKLLMTLWLPSMLAGLCLCWYRGAGFRLGSEFILPGIVACLALYAIALHRAFRGAHLPVWLPRAGTRIALALILGWIADAWPPFMDLPRHELTYRLNEGPYQGLYTDPEKGRSYEKTLSLVRASANLEGRIVFYPRFVAGYLMTLMRPGSRSLWGCYFKETAHICDDYYYQHRSPQDLLVRVQEECDVRLPDGTCEQTSQFQSWVQTSATKVAGNESVALYKFP